MALMTRPDGLRAIFDQGQLVLMGDLLELRHVGRVAIQVHGNHGLGARRDAANHLFGIEQTGLRIDVGEHHARAGEGNGLGGGDRRVRRGDHLIARP